MSRDNYTVVRHRHGIAVMGRIPAGELVAPMDVWNTRKDMYVFGDITAKLGAVMALATQAGAEAWRTELGIEAPKQEARP